jgi:hypothetical protein
VKLVILYNPGDNTVSVGEHGPTGIEFFGSLPVKGEADDIDFGVVAGDGNRLLMTYRIPRPADLKPSVN